MCRVVWVLSSSDRKCFELTKFHNQIVITRSYSGNKNLSENEKCNRHTTGCKSAKGSIQKGGTRVLTPERTKRQERGDCQRIQ